jgi:prophage regulatory protein
MSDNSHPIGTLPETGYVRQTQLIPVIFPFSSATLWRKVKAGTFPRPVKLGPRMVVSQFEIFVIMPPTSERAMCVNLMLRADVCGNKM